MFLGMRVGIPMQGAGGLWSPYSASLAALLAEASGSGLVLDFTRNIAFRSGTQSTITGVSGWSYTRSGTRWAGGTSFAANTPRIVAGQGIRITAGATNLFLNSDVGATQSITLPASAHTLAFEGTGSITLGGTGSGTLNGTGVSNRVSLTFTPGAGSVSFTVTGTCTNVQVESGSTATDYIPAAGASATAGADAASVTGLSFPSPFSIICVYSTSNASQPTSQPQPIDFTRNASRETHRVTIFEGTSTRLDMIVRPPAGGGSVTQVSGLPARPVRRTAAASIGTSRQVLASNGILSAALSEVGPTSSDVLFLHNYAGADGQYWNIATAILPRALTDTELQNGTA